MPHLTLVRDRPRARLLVRAAGALALITLVVLCLLPLRDDLDTGTVALILLVPPVVAASGGAWLGVGAAVASGLAFSFMFTQPYESFRI